MTTSAATGAPTTLTTSAATTGSGRSDSTALGAYALGLTDPYQPADPIRPCRALKVLPNLDIVATGTSPADRLILDAYAAHLRPGLGHSQARPCWPRSTPAAVSI